MAKLRDRWPVKVGDTVWVSSGTRRWSQGVVEKVGHKLIHVKEGGWRTSIFYLDTGQRRDGFSGSVRTLEHHVDVERHAELVKTLREECGIEFSTGGRGNWSADALEALLNSAREALNTHPNS